MLRSAGDMVCGSGFGLAETLFRVINRMVANLFGIRLGNAVLPEFPGPKRMDERLLALAWIKASCTQVISICNSQPKSV